MNYLWYSTGLSLFWTNCRKYNLDIPDVVRLLCTAPAELCGLTATKGRIAVGYDADFCVWDPTAEFTVSPDIIQFQNKANPYMGTKLQGLVHATVVRGHHVFEDSERFGEPKGRLLRNNATTGDEVDGDDDHEQEDDDY